MFLHNNREENVNFCRQKIFIEDRHLQHDSIFHNHKSQDEIRSIRNRHPYSGKLARRFIDNQQDEEKMNDDDTDDINDNGLTIYKAGELMNYKNKHSSRYIWNKYKDLKSEWLAFFNINVETWDEKIRRAKGKSKSKFIKQLISNDGQDKSISPVRILVIWEYTSNDYFQLILCKISRKTRKDCNGSHSKLKKEHGEFGHTFKLLTETIEKFGSNMRNDKQYQILYRGLGVKGKFNSSTISCYTPTSTTTSFLVATTFAFGEGCILELHQHWKLNSFYLGVKYLSRYPLEEEQLFYGKHSQLFVMYIRHPVINDIDHILCCFSNIALIEDLISDTKNEKRVHVSKQLKRRKSSKDLKQKYLSMKKYNIYGEDEQESVGRLADEFRKYIQYMYRKDLILKCKNDVNSNNIQMIQLNHILLSKKLICLRDDLLVRGINKAFGFDDDKLRIDYVMKIFQNVEHIVFKYDVDQSRIFEYCLSNVNKKYKVWKIIAYGTLENECERLFKEYTNIEWCVFDEKHKVVWRKSIVATDEI